MGIYSWHLIHLSGHYLPFVRHVFSYSEVGGTGYTDIAAVTPGRVNRSGM
jgi:hypothetical protein